jgi:hypothetical protein
MLRMSWDNWIHYNISVPLDLKVTCDTRLILYIYIYTYIDIDSIPRHIEYPRQLVWHSVFTDIIDDDYEDECDYFQDVLFNFEQILRMSWDNWIPKKLFLK